jgi:hypothetical protein
VGFVWPVNGRAGGTEGRGAVSIGGGTNGGSGAVSIGGGTNGRKGCGRTEAKPPE